MSEARASETSGPHGAIPTADAREEFVAELFDRLWDQYRARVSHVATYERVIQQAGARFVNDHIAFRTIAGQQPLTGIASISRIFEPLGYRPAGVYQFENKHLVAIHYQHPNAEFPKLFISELRTWELAPDSQSAIMRTLKSHRKPLSNQVLYDLSQLANRRPGERAKLMETVVRQFHELPWNVPEKQHVMAVNSESQYGAWVLVNGYNVNHFTSLINSHQTDVLDDIEKTSDALRSAGVPMKPHTEGAPGSILRQTATEACVIDVAVREEGREQRMPWTYAYFELAERGNVVDPATGNSVRFEGFLGEQATHLFEMTKVKSS